MSNKTLQRIIRKTLSVQSPNELSTVLDQLASRIADENCRTQFKEFQEGLLSCIETLDSAITDLDRVIDIRDRSLAISSQELMALNEKITAESQKQREVLNRLQNLLRLLREGQAASSETEQNDLNALVSTVDQLVKNQMNLARDLKMFFEEGLRISSAMSFRALEVQLKDSVSNLLAMPANIKIYFSGTLYGLQDNNQFFACNEYNQPGEELNAAAAGTEHFQSISSSKGNGILAFLKMDLGPSVKPETHWPRVQPLLPNVSTTLENIRLLQEEKHRLHMEAELQTARFVQMALLPPSEPIIARENLEICGYYQSASECGGDWWSSIEMADGRNIVFVGDVTGHGTGSAMVCAVVKGYCESIADRKNVSLAIIFEELNRLVYRVARDTDRAMTMAAVAIDPDKSQLTLVNAGHPPPIVLRPAADSAKPLIQYLISPGNILGINERVEYKEKIFPFRKGDAIVLYSDGVVEYPRSDKEIYGDRRLYRVLALAGMNSSARDLNTAVIQDLREFSLGNAPADDVTAVVVKAV